MPVYKFRTFDEAEKAVWNFNPDDAYYKRVINLFGFAQRLNPLCCPTGVFKYRTLEAANQQSEEWTISHCQRKMKGDFQGRIMVS